MLKLKFSVTEGNRSQQSVINSNCFQVLPLVIYHSSHDQAKCLPLSKNIRYSAKFVKMKVLQKCAYVLTATDRPIRKKSVTYNC
jgi:hypothetical protein